MKGVGGVGVGMGGGHGAIGGDGVKVVVGRLGGGE